MPIPIEEWIAESVAAPEVQSELTAKRMAEAEARGVWARVRALEGAVRAARLRLPGAGAGAKTLCKRILLITSIFDLPEVQREAGRVDRGLVDGEWTGSAESEGALDRLLDMATRAQWAHRPAPPHPDAVAGRVALSVP